MQRSSAASSFAARTHATTGSFGFLRHSPIAAPRWLGSGSSPRRFSRANTLSTAATHGSFAGVGCAGDGDFVAVPPDLSEQAAPRSETTSTERIHMFGPVYPPALSSLSSSWSREHRAHQHRLGSRSRSATEPEHRRIEHRYVDVAPVCKLRHPVASRAHHACMVRCYARV